MASGVAVQITAVDLATATINRVNRSLASMAALVDR